MPKYKGFTHAQSLILGYLISSGGNAYAGSTAKEIIDATGLSQNGVYKALRSGIPGVAVCKSKTKTGSIMYYANPDAMAVKASGGSGSDEPTIWDSAEWSGVPPEVFAGLSYTVDNKPASDERIEELIVSAANLLTQKKDGYHEAIAIASQAIALHALSLAKTTTIKEAVNA